MRIVNVNAINQSIRVWAYDSSGDVITGEAYNSAGIAASVVVRNSGRIVSTTALTLVARSTPDAHRDSAFTEVGNGEYVIDLPDSYFATAGNQIDVTLTSTAITGGYVLSESLMLETVMSQVGMAPVVERSPDDTRPITFTFPVSGATITGQVSKNNAAYGAVAGAIAFLRTEGGKYYYTLAFNAADRPTSEGTARYIFTDNTDTVYVTLRVAVAGGTGTTEAELSQEALNSIIAGVQGVHVGITEAVESSALTIIRGDTWVQSITDLGSLTGKKLTFALKTNPRDSDANSVIFIDEDDGLVKIKGVTAGDSSLGSITIDDANAGDITIRLESSVTLQLATGQYHDALKAIKDAADFTLRNNGVTTVILGVIQEVS